MIQTKSSNTVDVDEAAPASNGDSADDDSRSRSRCQWWQLDGNKDAQAILLDQVATSPLLLTFYFVSIAIIAIAEERAGCEDVDDDDYECEEKFWGVKPSSLTTLINTFVAITSAFLLPIFGALVDYTAHRKKIGYSTAALIILLELMQLCIQRKTLELVLIIYVLLPPLFFLHTTTRLAYFPRMTDNKQTLMKYVAIIDATKYISHISYLILIYTISKLFDLSFTATARICVIIAFVISSPLMHRAWTKISDVPALQERPKNNNIVISSFKKLMKTFHEIENRNEPMKWILLSNAISNPVFAGIFSIGPTFGKEHLDFNASQSALAVIMISIASIPGALICKHISAKMNPLVSMRLFMLSVFLSGVFSATFVTGPDSKIAGYIFFGILGLSAGGYYVAETALFSMLVPEVKETELMGVYVSFVRIFMWLPPLMFTLINEAGIEMNIVLLIIMSLSCIGLLFTVKAGSFEHIIEVSEKYKTDLRNEASQA